MVARNEKLNCSLPDRLGGAQCADGNLSRLAFSGGACAARFSVTCRNTGLSYNRNYSPSLAAWTSQDPAGFINGADTYQFVLSSPVGNVDATGLVKPDIQEVNEIASRFKMTPEQRRAISR